jgi:hypothetical protein
MSLVPVLQMRYDENSIPVSAKCSMCGTQMPQCTPRIMNPIENVGWFAAQFGLHVAQNHPPNTAKAFHGGAKKTPSLKADFPSLHVIDQTDPKHGS